MTEEKKNQLVLVPIAISDNLIFNENNLAIFMKTFHKIQEHCKDNALGDVDAKIHIDAKDSGKIKGYVCIETTNANNAFVKISQFIKDVPVSLIELELVWLKYIKTADRFDFAIKENEKAFGSIMQGGHILPGNLVVIDGKVLS